MTPSTALKARQEHDHESTLRATIVLGWVLMLLTLLAMFCVDLARSAIDENFSAWRRDMSQGGLLVMLGVLGVYLLTPMFALNPRGRWFRWLLVALGALATLFFIAHQVGHLLAGDKPFGMRHVLDFSHHLLGAWVTVAALRWARLPAHAGSA